MGDPWKGEGDEGDEKRRRRIEMNKQLCEVFQARVENLNMKKGIRRERAFVEFMAGAAAAIIATHGEESPEAKAILNWVVWGGDD